MYDYATCWGDINLIACARFLYDYLFPKLIIIGIKNWQKTLHHPLHFHDYIFATYIQNSYANLLHVACHVCKITMIASSSTSSNYSRERNIYAFIVAFKLVLHE